MSAATRETIAIGSLEIRFLRQGDQSGRPTVFEVDVPADARVPAAHSHDGYEELIYGLAGTLRWTVDGEETEVGPGETLAIPRGAVHRFDNDSGADATMLAIVTPGLLRADYFRELGAILAAGGPPDLQAVAETMRRHGLTPAA